MMRFASIAFIFLVLFIFKSSQDVFAYNSGDVLGLEVVGRAQLPPTIEGPGLLLSDSPFYFLDQIKQQVRLFLAFSPSQKARLHADIAGERLAELRFALAKNNQDAIDKALLGFTQSYRSAAKRVTEAKMRGENVSTLAKEITDGLKLKQQALDSLEASSTGDMKVRVEAAQAVLMSAKVEIEDSLDEADLVNEIRYDIDRITIAELRSTSESAKMLSIVVAELEKQASQAGQQQLKNREEVLKTVIAQTESEYQKSQEVTAAKELEKKLALKKEVVEQVRKTMEAAQKAAQAFDKIKTSR